MKSVKVPVVVIAVAVILIIVLVYIYDRNTKLIEEMLAQEEIKLENERMLLLERFSANCLHNSIEAREPVGFKVP